MSKRLRSKGVQTSIHETPLPTSTSGVPLVASGSPIAKALQELDRRLGMLRSETKDLERKRGRLAVTVESQLDRKEDTSESAGDTSSDVRNPVTDEGYMTDMSHRATSRGY